MTWIRRTAYLALGICLTVVVWITALQWVTFDVNHYMTQFEKQDWVPAAGMDRENLEHTASEIIRYLKDEKDDFQTYAVKDGEYQALYDQRERVHMEDVLFLYQRAGLIRNIGLAGLLILLGLLRWFDPKWKRRTLRAFFYTGLANVDLLILLALLIWIDFTKYFTYFHLILFDNDLWILDPNRHVLIQLLPEQFFVNTALQIGGYAMGTLLLLGMISWMIERQLREGEIS